MSEREGFYLTLTSDSSLKDKPDNRTSSFTVVLPRTISLQGSWEMALVEIAYPHTIQNVTKDNNKLVYEYKIMVGNECKKIETTEIEIAIGHYPSVGNVINVINKAIDTFFNRTQTLMFNVDVLTAKVQCDAKIRDEFTKQADIITNYKHAGQRPEIAVLPHRLFFQGTLAVLLGFNPFEHDLLKNTIGENLANTKLAISSKLLLYCDLIAPQFIGHRQSQVLKTMNTLNPSVSYGDIVEKSFKHLQYVNLMTTCFDEVHFDLRGGSGNLCPFAFGSSMVLLHLRPKK